jgi:hypothetical protein
MTGMLDRLKRFFAQAPAPKSDSSEVALPYRDDEALGVRYRVHLENQLLRLGATPATGLSAQMPKSAFVSGAMMAHKAKQVDDGLYAAVELAAQNGLGAKRGKRFLIERMLERLDGTGPAHAILEASAVVSGARSSERATPEAGALADAFLSNPLRSKPLGFYTWSDELSQIFRQDRMLQSDLDSAPDLPKLIAALSEDDEARAVYERTLSLFSRLTNPFSKSDLRPLISSAKSSLPSGVDSLSFLPPSRSHETELIKKLYGDTPIPDGFDLASELIANIRSGGIDLAPADDAGFYAIQTWALETLAAPRRAPEAAHLVLEATYETHLEELFRAILTSTRETHVKQLELPLAGCAMPRIVDVIIRPKLTVEPLPTFYGRRAESYRFVRALLDETFGEHGWSKLKGLRPGGFAKLSLRDELAQIIDLFEGARIKSMQELGMPTAGSTAVFDGWAKSLDDPDLAADVRLMVPVYYDEGRKQTKVWMLVGWAQRWMRIEFEKDPRVELLGEGTANVKLEPASAPLVAPVMVEALVSRLLDRSEFRALCDQMRTPEEIVAALQ